MPVAFAQRKYRASRTEHLFPEMRKTVMGRSRIDDDLLIAPDYAGSDADQHYKDEAYFQFNYSPRCGRGGERKPSSQH